MADSAALQRAKQMFLDLVHTGDGSLETLRANYDIMFDQFPVPGDAEITPVEIAGVSCLKVAAPGVSTARTLVYCHGGGYCMGRAHNYKSLACALSVAADAVVILVDYRLAPEHPHPAAVEDAVAVYTWARKEYPDSTISLAGDSAGAGLVTATCMALRDAGQTGPDALVCMSPFADLAGEGESMQTRAEEDPIVSFAIVEGLGGAYLDGRDPHNTPLASPVHATDFSGFPPTLILVGTCEALYDDSIRLHEKLDSAGTEVELEIAEDMIHVWPVFASFLPEAQAAVERMGGFLRKHG